MDKIAEAIDTLENLIAALSMPMPDHIHVQCLRGQLPDVLTQLRDGYLAAGGDDHWGA